MVYLSGLPLSIGDPEGIEEAFANLGIGPDGIDLILAADAEHIQGLGDWGVAGLALTISALAVHTAVGGIDPTRVIPVMLDVGAQP